MQLSTDKITFNTCKSVGYNKRTSIPNNPTRAFIWMTHIQNRVELLHMKTLLNHVNQAILYLREVTDHPLYFRLSVCPKWGTENSRLSRIYSYQQLILTKYARKITISVPRCFHNRSQNNYFDLKLFCYYLLQSLSHSTIADELRERYIHNLHAKQRATLQVKYQRGDHHREAFFLYQLKGHTVKPFAVAGRSMHRFFQATTFGKFDRPRYSAA